MLHQKWYYQRGCCTKNGITSEDVISIITKYSITSEDGIGIMTKYGTTIEDVISIMRKYGITIEAGISIMTKRVRSKNQGMILSKGNNDNMIKDEKNTPPRAAVPDTALYDPFHQ
jgi:hypothetical protein